MSLIDRYVYAVVKRLPVKQREDIEKEIRTLIEDMLEQHQGNEPEEVKVQKVLLELGDPEALADNYRENKRYLIGPQNFDNYIFVLKIVTGAVFIGLSVATITGSFFSNQQDVISIIVDYIASLLSGVLQAFAWVTGIFAIAEYNGVKLGDQDTKKEGWSLSQLPVIPKKESEIPRVESVVGILFTTIFASLLYFAPQVFAAYISDGAGSVRVIPVFNLEVLSNFKALIVITFILGIAKEALKLIAGRWSLKLSASITVINVISVILTLLIFTNQGIWNPNFLSQLFGYLNVETASKLSWLNMSRGVIIVLVFAYIIEIATTMYKGVKYSVKQ